MAGFEPVTASFRGASIPLVQHGDVSELARGAVGPAATAAPHWACLWPSGRGLMEAVAEAGEWTGRSALEIGCGVGAGAVAAARAGADPVVAADLEPQAASLVAENARLNDAEIQFRSFDWNEPPSDLGTFDRILAADVLYEDGMLRGVLRFIASHLKGDGQALLTDPFRVPASGIQGAARLKGFSVESRTLRPGTSAAGGVQLHILSRSRRM